MVRRTNSALALIGRLATPAPHELGGEVHGKAKHFFREVCRWVPWTVRNYKLEELTDVPTLRSNLAFMFRQSAHLKDPRVVDILIYKGREELEAVALQHKQRHHLVSTFLKEPAARKEVLRKEKSAVISPFLESFYRNQPII